MPIVYLVQDFARERVLDTFTATSISDQCLIIESVSSRQICLQPSNQCFFAALSVTIPTGLTRRIYRGNILNFSPDARVNQHYAFLVFCFLFLYNFSAVFNLKKANIKIFLVKTPRYLFLTNQ